MKWLLIALFLLSCKTSDDHDVAIVSEAPVQPEPPAPVVPRELAPGEIPIGVAEFPPFKYVENGRVIGSDTEIVESVFKRMGMSPKISVAPWKRIQAEGARGSLAAIYTMTKNPEREKIYHFSAPISTVQDVFFKRKNETIGWNGESYDELADDRIGIAGGYNYPPKFMTAISDGTLKRVDKITDSSPEIQNLRKLVKGRLDLVVCEISVCQYLIRLHAPQFDEVVPIEKPIGDVRTFHVAFSKAWPESELLARNFDAALAQFVKEGGRKPIFKKYGIQSPLD